MFASGKTAAVSASTELDAQFNYVTMLLHGDGTNGAQNNTFLDSSTNNFTITRNGNTTQGTFTPYGSNWSNYFNGSSSLSIASSNTVLPTGTQDFSVELFVNWQTQSGSFPQIISNPTTNGFQIYYDVSAGALAVGIFNVANVITYTIAQSTLTGVWTHLVVTRSGNTFRLFVDGVLRSNGTNTISFASPTTQYIASDGSRPYTGYISNVRTVLGSIPTAYQTSSTTNGASVFTPSTTPLTAVSGTALLTCQSNRFMDNSSNAFSITSNGSPSVQRFSPFSPTTAYSTSVIGGSGYFDGSGDYLRAANNAAYNLNSVSFTVECWIYWNSVSGEQNIVEQFTDPSGPGWTLYKFAPVSGSPSGSIDFYGGSGSINSGVTAVAGQWYHLAISRNNSTGTTSFYVNGTRTATATFGVGSSASTDLLVGVRNGGATWLNGYMEDLRVVKGSYVYDPTATTITIPSAPLTAITNTSLLLNYTNAGILDNAMMNDLETVGNAQISTSVKKYGTGSMAFDGTGDLLVSSPKNILALGGGNFTIEMWIYPNNVSTNEAWLVAQTDYASNTGWSVFLNNNIVKFRLGNSGGTIQSSASVVASAWQHLALSRVGTTLTMYLDGTSIGSGTVNNFTDANLASVVGGITTTTGWNNNLAYNGYIDDLRITKGYARYTANFTPPTAAFFNTGPY